jgi:hypothetical protein
MRNMFGTFTTHPCHPHGGEAGRGFIDAVHDTYLLGSALRALSLEEGA